MAERMEESVSERLPQEEDKKLLKILIEIFKEEGAEGVAVKISSIIDALKEA